MFDLTRRDFLRTAGAAAGALALAPLGARAAEDKPGGFTLPKLPYAFDALEDAIDAKTMEIHHDRHHKTYVDNLNKALAAHPDYLKMNIGELMRAVDKMPQEIRQAVINNGGGHLNHYLFWQMMAPAGKRGEPKGELLKGIDEAFGSLDKFKAALADAAMKRFGSGWAWLVHDKGKLAVVSTANQDPPILKGQHPLLGVDVWEHAYYLRYQNKRADYVAAWWKVVDWNYVAERHNHAAKG